MIGRRGRLLASAALVTVGLIARPAAAQVAKPLAVAPTCEARSFRWQEDCSNLASVELTGLDRLRYRPLTDDGHVWLTLGGEARTRMEVLQDVDFGIKGHPGYVSIAGRFLAHADLRTDTGLRLFTQVGIVQQDGRKPGARAQDESGLDVTQMFVDAPIEIGDAKATFRLGRQELELSGNRLVSPRDGATLRRSFEGARVDIVRAGGRLTLLSVRPLDLQDEAFSDHADRTERFTAVSLDLPRAAFAGAAVNLFYFDRDRGDARFLRGQGDDRRYSFGARYARTTPAWRIDAQGTAQVGRTAGKPVRAYFFGLTADHPLGGPHDVEVGIDVVGASGDKVHTRTVETFDPTYPNNGGLSDAPLFYQTNYVFAGGGVSARFAGATWAAQSNLIVRNSTTDAIYANGRPIPVAFGGARLTGLLSQVSVRRSWGWRYDAYASLVRADAFDGLRQAGGHDAFYSRVQLTARF